MTLDPERFYGLADFRRALRGFLAASETISRAAGVTQQQYQAMLAISAWPGGALTMKDLAEELLLTHHATVQLTDRLTKAGLAQRTPSIADRRSVFLSLTPQGGALLDGLAADHLAEMLRREPKLTAALKRLKRLSADQAPTEDNAK